MKLGPWTQFPLPPSDSPWRSVGGLPCRGLEVGSWPWLVWLSGLSAGLRIKGSPVQFPVWGACLGCSRVPSVGHARGNHILMFPFLPPFPSLRKKKKKKKKCVGSEFLGKQGPHAVSDTLEAGQAPVSPHLPALPSSKLEGASPCLHCHRVLFSLLPIHCSVALACAAPPPSPWTGLCVGCVWRVSGVHNRR